MTDIPDGVVELSALGMAKEIGWGTFSHFDPNDMRRVARAALEAAKWGEMLLYIRDVVEGNGNIRDRGRALLSSIGASQQ